MKNRLLFFIFLFFILLTWFSRSIPFFWDGTFFSQLSLAFYENGFNYFIAPENFDTGGFPLYSVYLANIWKLFGKSLLVSHFALLPFLIGIAFEYFKLAKQFLAGKMLVFAMLLLVLEPCFITQSVLMGYDVLLIYFYFLSLNALLLNKTILFQVSLALLCLSSVRGMLLACSLLLIDAYIHRKINYSMIKKYVLALVCVIFWVCYHQLKTGWFIINPIREDTHERILPFSMIVKQLIYSIWKIIDFGRIGLWFFFIFYFFILQKNKYMENKKTIFALVFIPLLVLIFGMIPFGNPIGHKYFIVSFLLLNIAFCFALQQLQNRKTITIVVAFSSMLLISGNFWIYPSKYGNGWDASLKIISFFELKKEMDNYILIQHISSQDVGTQFPLIANKSASDLTENTFQYQNVWSGPLSNYDYFLYSNVINTDIPEQFEDAIKTWKPIKTIHSGLITITLFKNPSFILNQHLH